MLRARTGNSRSMTDYAKLRQNMVRTQIMTVDVSDPRVRRAMVVTPRELFVADNLRQIAYAEQWIKTSPHRWMSPAGLMASLLQEAAITDRETALVIAPGTGYTCAVIARLAAAVVGLEDDRNLARDASTTLAELGIDNAIVESGDLICGLPEQGPYDVIWIDGVIEMVSQEWFAQLALHGRLVAVIRQGDMCIWRIYRKSVHGQITIADCGSRDQGAPILPQLARPPRFVF